jgi:hypothetical protein
LIGGEGFSYVGFSIDRRVGAVPKRMVRSPAQGKRQRGRAGAACCPPGTPPSLAPAGTLPSWHTPLLAHPPPGTPPSWNITLLAHYPPGTLPSWYAPAAAGTWPPPWRTGMGGATATHRAPARRAVAAQLRAEAAVVQPELEHVVGVEAGLAVGAGLAQAHVGTHNSGVGHLGERAPPHELALMHERAGAPLVARAALARQHLRGGGGRTARVE